MFLPASTRQKIAILPRGGHGQAELLRLARARPAFPPPQRAALAWRPACPHLRARSTAGLCLSGPARGGSRPAVMCLCACARQIRQGRVGTPRLTRLAARARQVGRENVPTCYGGGGERYAWPAAEPVPAPPGTEPPAEKAAAALAAVGTTIGHAVTSAVRELEALPGCLSRESVRTL